MKCQVWLRTGKGGRQILCGRAGRKNRLSYPGSGARPATEIGRGTNGTIVARYDKPITACRFCRQAGRATLSSTAR